MWQTEEKESQLIIYVTFYGIYPIHTHTHLSVMVECAISGQSVCSVTSIIYFMFHALVTCIKFLKRQIYTLEYSNTSSNEDNSFWNHIR